MRDREAMPREYATPKKAHTEEQPAGGDGAASREWSTPPTPEQASKVDAVLSKPEFEYGDFQEVLAELPPSVRVWAMAELHKRSYVPPSVRRALDRGEDASSYLCGSGRAKTPGLGRQPEVLETADVDASHEGLSRMAEASAHISLAIMSLGIGGAAEGTAHVGRGFTSAAQAVEESLPWLQEGATLLSKLDPERAAVYEAAGAGLSAAKAGIAFSKAGEMVNASERLHGLSGLMEATTAVESAVAAGATASGDKELQAKMKALHYRLKVLRTAVGGGISGIRSGTR